MQDEVASDRPFSNPRSETKFMVGDKRSSIELDERSELGKKHAKIEPAVHFQERVDANGKICCLEEPKVSNHSSKANSGLKTLDVDLNTQESENQLPNFSESRPFNWDLNAENASPPPEMNLFYPYKTHENLKSDDAWECGSTTGPLQEKDPIRVWKEMKQNGFLSCSSHGGIPLPKPRGRRGKGKGVLMEKKMEIAKREHIDRFARVAAPSGLLNELNPGIINHVRNSKQVYSIIEALVRSEKGGRKGGGAKEIADKKRGFVYSDHSGGNGDSSKLQKRDFDKTTSLSLPKQGAEEDMLLLKLSSTMGSENASCLSNEKPSNLGYVSSLSLKAANVASQWLELLCQDIKGRLAALRRSKKRVRAVIHTELPLLVSQEFSGNKENDSCVEKNSYSNANAHQAKWSALFEQMDKALSEEENKLESWINQVKEMQLHCERGLQYFHHNSLQGSKLQETIENDSRLEKVKRSENELAVRASAASIYSTCNFLLSTENSACS